MGYMMGGGGGDVPDRVSNHGSKLSFHEIKSNFCLAVKFNKLRLFIH